MKTMTAVLNHEVLSLDEQVELAKEIEAGRNAQAQLDADERAKRSRQSGTRVTDAVAGAAPLTRSARVQIKKVAVAGEAARQTFISSNMRLVHYCASRRQEISEGGSEAMAEAIQDGTIGLIEAVDRWEWRKGFKFSTYATWWIDKRLTEWAAKRGDTPATMSTQAREVSGYLSRAEDDLLARLHRHPTDAELAEELGSEYSAEQVAAWRISSPKSIDTDNGEALVLTSGDEALEAAAEVEMASAVHRVLEILPERQRRVVMSRFGIVGGEQRSQPQVAEHLGLTLAQVQGDLKEAMKLLSADESLRMFEGQL
jgi:RNA polymerase primary sigma factor